MSNLIIVGKKYKLVNDYIVTFTNTNLRYYKFQIDWVENGNGDEYPIGAVFREDGIGYDDDCGFKIDWTANVE